MTPRKASKPAARTVKRTAWLVVFGDRALKYISDIYFPRIEAITERDKVRANGWSAEIARATVTYEVPRRTKR